jgi:MFS family permease
MPAHRRNTRWALWTAAAFFALYLGNVLLGKLAAMQGVLEGWQAGNVIEALFLFAAVVAFVVAAIQRESRDAAEARDPHTSRANGTSNANGTANANSVGGNDGTA